MFTSTKPAAARSSVTTAVGHQASLSEQPISSTFCFFYSTTESPTNMVVLLAVLKLTS